MTAIASSAATIDRRDLMNAILEMSEKDFLDLVDTRLNRPKGFRALPRQVYVEIIDANDKPSIVDRWSEQCLIDELFLQLATTKSVVYYCWW
jgi:hypothetical protein